MRLRAILTVVGSVLLLGGCATHEPKFRDAGEPRLSPLDEVRDTSDRLITAPSRAIASVPTDALTALTRAAAIQYQGTGGAGMRRLTERYADALLDARTVVDGQQVFPSGPGAPKTSPSTTLRAGLALAEAYRATRAPRYVAAVRSIARRASDEAFGLEKFQGGYVMRTAGSPRRRSVALTALAAAFMNEAAQLDGGRWRRFADGALRTVMESQAAVGRWWAFVDTTVPMTLEQWGTTLNALSKFPAGEPQAVQVTGVSAIYQVAFTPDGAVRSTALTKGQRKGIAVALRALASGPPQPFAADAFDVAGERLANDAVGQGSDASFHAEVALAFATRYRQLKAF